MLVLYYTLRLSQCDFRQKYFFTIIDCLSLLIKVQYSLLMQYSDKLFSCLRFSALLKVVSIVIENVKNASNNQVLIKVLTDDERLCLACTLFY